MLRIEIPVENNEVLLGDVYLNVDVRVNTIIPPQTTTARLAVERIQTRLRIEISEAIHRALKDMED